MKIFHHNDADGRCAAFIASHWTVTSLGVIPEFREMDYATPFPFDDIEIGEIVYILDYSISPEEMQLLMTKTTAITWIDHHKTAIEKYEEYPDVWVNDIAGIRKKEGASASMLAWQYFAPYKSKTPRAVELIDDWDIWKHEFSETKPFIAWFNSENTNPSNKNFWLYLFKDINVACGTSLGKIMLTYRDGWAKDVLKHIGFEADFDGLKVFAANIPHSNSEYFISVDGSKYDAFMPFYYDGNKDMWTYSMYATHPDVDVSIVCKNNGGGGHRGAAGFTSPLGPNFLCRKEK